jgi:hypothetical protein
MMTLDHTIARFNLRRAIHTLRTTTTNGTIQHAHDNAWWPYGGRHIDDTYITAPTTHTPTPTPGDPPATQHLHTLAHHLNNAKRHLYTALRLPDYTRPTPTQPSTTQLIDLITDTLILAGTIILTDRTINWTATHTATIHIDHATRTLKHLAGRRPPNLRCRNPRDRDRCRGWPIHDHRNQLCVSCYNHEWYVTNRLPA